ncbi:MAG: 7-cyano-7-deazaguanine synthase [Promethearchaeota archaeon]
MSNCQKNLEEKLFKKIQKVKDLLKNKKVLVAFSGGVDSTLTLLLSLFYAKKTIPVFFNGPSYPQFELNEAKNICKLLDIKLKIIDVDPTLNENFKKNPNDRCYYCKKMMMQQMVKLKQEMKFNLIIEGTNKSDIKGHRPGFKAIRELNILSPLYEADITKNEVRQILGYLAENIENFSKNSYLGSFKFNMENIREIKKILKKIHNKPASPCLSSRIQYGIQITPEILKMIEEAEGFLREKLNLDNLRVRFHSNYLARIEFPKDTIDKALKTFNKKEIVSKLKEIGFKYITIDLEGFRSGSLNL